MTPSNQHSELNVRDLDAALNCLAALPSEAHHALVARAQLDSLVEQLEATRDALDKGRRFERAYQESLGATPTATQFEILDNLQSAFLDAYLAVDSFPAKRPT